MSRPPRHPEVTIRFRLPHLGIDFFDGATDEEMAVDHGWLTQRYAAILARAYPHARVEAEPTSSNPTDSGAFAIVEAVGCTESPEFWVEATRILRHEATRFGGVAGDVPGDRVTFGGVPEEDALRVYGPDYFGNWAVDRLNEPR